MGAEYSLARTTFRMGEMEYDCKITSVQIIFYQYGRQVLGVALEEFPELKVVTLKRQHKVSVDVKRNEKGQLLAIELKDYQTKETLYSYRSQRQKVEQRKTLRKSSMKQSKSNKDVHVTFQS